MNWMRIKRDEVQLQWRNEVSSILLFVSCYISYLPFDFICSYMFIEIFHPISYESCFFLSFFFRIKWGREEGGRVEDRRINEKSLDIQLCSSRYAAGCCGVFANWKSLTGRPTSLSKHIKRINEALRAWRTCKLRDLNNGWADKTSLAIYPTVSSVPSIISQFPPSVRSSRFFVIFDRATKSSF